MRYWPHDRVMAFGIRFPRVVDGAKDRLGRPLYAMPGGRRGTRPQCIELARQIAGRMKQTQGVQ